MPAERAPINVILRGGQTAGHLAVVDNTVPAGLHAGRVRAPLRQARCRAGRDRPAVRGLQADPGDDRRRPAHRAVSSGRACSPRAAGTLGIVLIAQMSDLHVGGQRHHPELLAAAIEEINEAEPHLVVVAGDLTEDGYPDQLEVAQAALERLACERAVLIPGNHDARHVGYLWFEEAFGTRHTCLRERFGDMDVALVAIDTSKPDLDEGEVGREHYGWIGDNLSSDADLRVFVCHHHLVPIPATGREANQVRDAGDVLRLLAQSGTDIVLSGHRHVPWVWPIAGMLLIHSGTVSTMRARGFRHPAYNLITVDADSVSIELRVPAGARRPLGTFPRAWPAELAWHADSLVERPGRGR